MKRNEIIAVGLGAFALIALSAGAGAWVMSQPAAVEEAPVVSQSSKKETITWREPARQQPVAVQQATNCDDDNIVGKVVGGVGGGLVGSQIGGGKGKTAATIGGALGGTLLGEELIPTKNVTCR